LTILTLTTLTSCFDSSRKCESVQEWEVGEYKIVKSKCPDLVLAYYYSYDIYKDNQEKGNVKQIDSCIFGWQATNEKYLMLNICDKTTNEIIPTKKILKLNTIDSLTIFSNEHNETRRLSKRQIETFVNDWNNSKVRNYEVITLDSVFSIFPAYQYKLTVFESGKERLFFGYNFLILDTSKWQYIMNKGQKLDYFHSYWTQQTNKESKNGKTEEQTKTRKPNH
jgi:hypothetical protein